MHKLKLSEYSSHSAFSTFATSDGLGDGMCVGVLVGGDKIGREVGTGRVPSCSASAAGRGGGGASGVEASPSPVDEGYASVSNSSGDAEDVLFSPEVRFSDKGTAIATTMAARSATRPAATRHRRVAIVPANVALLALA